MDTASRLARLRTAVADEDFDALLISSVANVTFVSGFTGDDSLALVTG